MGEGGVVGPGALWGPAGPWGGVWGVGGGRGVAGPLVPIGPIDPFKGIPIVDPHLYGSAGSHFVGTTDPWEPQGDPGHLQ